VKEEAKLSYLLECLQVGGRRGGARRFTYMKAQGCTCSACPDMADIEVKARMSGVRH
jgi:hypothetical protein